MAPKSGRVRVDSHQFAICDPLIEELPVVGNRLVGVVPGRVTIITGLAMGTVSVTWETVAEPVDWHQRADDWDDIVEFSITSESPIRFGSIAGDPDTIGDIAGPGSYRVLMRVRDRFADYDDLNDDSRETYTFTAWLQHSGEIQIHKQTHQQGQMPAPPPRTYRRRTTPRHPEAQKQKPPHR